MSRILLIIDDNEEISSLIKNNFEARGFTVYTASDGASGLEQARSVPPDVLILDFNMPDMTGVEVYNELHKHPETAGIPIIFFSSMLLGMIKKMLVENPRVQFLKKPCTTQAIEKCVYEMLAMPKLAMPPPPPLADPPKSNN